MGLVFHGMHLDSWGKCYSELECINWEKKITVENYLLKKDFIADPGPKELLGVSQCCVTLCQLVCW